jgi:predicted nucleotidyltransferase
MLTTFRDPGKPMKNNDPTPFPGVNAILQRLFKSMESVLGEHLIGMYLEGSLANGDFDEDSDIDFVAVTDVEVTEDLFSHLQKMHDDLAATDSLWATELEGSYISQQALRRYDPANDVHPNIERGRGERLKMVDHGEVWNVHRHILREHGIVLFGPDPKALIDPITPGDLHSSMSSTLRSWATHILHHPKAIDYRGYQSYVVLTLCRILYTLQVGEVTSKWKSASWVKESTGEKWKWLIDRAWEGRHHSQSPANDEDVRQTLDFIKFTLERSGMQI